MSDGLFVMRVELAKENRDVARQKGEMWMNTARRIEANGGSKEGVRASMDLALAFVAEAEGFDKLIEVLERKGENGG